MTAYHSWIEEATAPVKGASTPCSFSSFSKLPYELREMIWKYSMTPRLVYMSIEPGGADPPPIRPPNYAPAPPIFHACTESREIALRHYKKYDSIAWWGGSEDLELPRHFYFNADIDVWYHPHDEYEDEAWLGQCIDHPYTPHPRETQYLLYRAKFLHEFLHENTEWQSSEDYKQYRLKTFQRYFPNLKMLYFLLPKEYYEERHLRDFTGFGQLREVPEEVWDVERKGLEERVWNWLSIKEIRKTCNKRGIDFRFVEERWV